MKETIIRRTIRQEYVLTKDDEKNVLRFLNGELTCREFGKLIGVSHQQAINLVSAICRQWYRQKKLIFKKHEERTNNKDT